MIDVNGTRYHLLLGRDDWTQAQSEAGKRRWEYDPDRETVRLQAEIYTFPRRREPDARLTPEQRRGADRDGVGHWYWLDDDNARIMARWAAASQAERLFPPGPGECVPPVTAGPFRPAQTPEPPEPEHLAGLAVTGEGYLVVGSPATGSLLVFDLVAFDGGFVRVTLPPPPGSTGQHTKPFDLTALPDGGVLVLDRVNKKVWRLDSAFRPLPVQPAVPGEPTMFQPKQGREHRPQVAPPAEPVNLNATHDPIAIDSLPDGSFWVLDAPAGDEASTLWRFSQTGSFEPQVIELKTINLVDDEADDLHLGQIQGHDLAYLPDRDEQGPMPGSGLLFIVDVFGNQAYALRVNLEGELTLRIVPKYFPLRNFAGTDLVAVWADGDVYYHQGRRWLPIKALPQMRYETEARLLLPVLDGRDPGCVWHRLCIDACIPPETAVLVDTRAADTKAELPWQPWQAQPQLYLRSGGSELPYSNLWRAAELARPSTGTWELLCQQTQGRYGQLRLTLVGNGRATPLVRALRLHYPRFSYLKTYLPATYQQDPQSAQFLENFLANPEGLLATIEGVIAQVQTLMDVRTVPAEAIEWLAGWIGLALEQGWNDYQRRLLLAHAPYFFQRRGTLPGLLQAVLLTVYPHLGPKIFQDDIDRSCSTVRIVEQFLTRSQPGAAVGDATELERVTSGDAKKDAEARAHRFTVMLPTSVNAATQRLVERIVNLEKPAHTLFIVKQYWALFRVGEVRLGLDTLLGEGGRFETFRLGQTALAEGTLGATFPNTLTNRTVITK